MKQISVRELRRSASATSLREWSPCEIVSDGEVVAMLLPPGVTTKHDVRQPKSVTELPFSKARQARGELSSIAEQE